MKFNTSMYKKFSGNNKKGQKFVKRVSIFGKKGKLSTVKNKVGVVDFIYSLLVRYVSNYLSNFCSNITNLVNQKLNHSNLKR